MSLSDCQQMLPITVEKGLSSGKNDLMSLYLCFLQIPLFHHFLYCADWEVMYFHHSHYMKVRWTKRWIIWALHHLVNINSPASWKLSSKLCILQKTLLSQYWTQLLHITIFSIISEKYHIYDVFRAAVA